MGEGRYEGEGCVEGEEGRDAGACRTSISMRTEGSRGLSVPLSRYWLNFSIVLLVRWSEIGVRKKLGSRRYRDIE